MHSMIKAMGDMHVHGCTNYNRFASSLQTKREPLETILSCMLNDTSAEDWMSRNQQESNSKVRCQGLQGTVHEAGATKHHSEQTIVAVLSFKTMITCKFGCKLASPHFRTGRAPDPLNPLFPV